jgi:hypothetical protein
LKAKQPAVEAIRLLGLWQRLASGHVRLAGGCACGVSGTSVQIQDYEQDILGFLRGRHGCSAASLGALLTELGRQRGGGAAELALLADLERSLSSFEEMHLGRAS